MEADQVSRLSQLLELLIEGAARFNLTSIREPQEIVLKHFLDSLAGVQVLGPTTGLRLVDVGSGAGFPGLPLKIARPGLQVSLLETHQKKAEFLRMVVDILGLEGIDVLPMRAEEAGRDPKHREGYDVAVSRAVAALRVLVEYCLPFVRLGGLMIAYKGPGVQEELKAADAAVEALGGSVSEIRDFLLPGVDVRRTLVVIRKDKPTPERYPRRPGVVSKRPI